MRKTKIICTIGPASESEERLRELMLAGMNVARFNFSHGSHEEHKAKFDRVIKVSSELKLPVATLLDGIEVLQFLVGFRFQSCNFLFLGINGI